MLTHIEHMANWLERRVQRQAELQNGADADLIRENRARARIGVASLLAGLGLSWIQHQLHVTGVLGTIFVLVGMALWLYGIVTLAWARQQSILLDKPEPKKPPSITQGK
ncbi:MAG TPA: hypothetical protein VMH31_12550 [Methylomirabilota bacterium]|nr:hypothetical protein [Methylomirabilota bacterium]